MKESSKLEAIKVSGETYERQYFPFGGFLFVKKDLSPDKIGSIVIAGTIKTDHSKFTSTGVIIRKSLFREFEDQYEEYLYSLLKRGDRIGFGTSVPLYSPSPPFYEFDLTEDEKMQYVTIHMKDVLCVILNTEEKRAEWSERFK